MKYKILVVDDEAPIRKTIRLQLEGTIYDVLEAEDGEKAIHVLNNENILEVILIICDVRMPKVDGIEAVSYFQSEVSIDQSQSGENMSLEGLMKISEAGPLDSGTRVETAATQREMLLVE